MDDTTPKFSVSDFLSSINQTLDYAYPSAIIEGEVISFKINQGKWVFFDLKDSESSISCFLPLFQLRIPLEDGMKVLVKGVPKVTKWGKFSFTVQQIMPVGKGTIKKSLELLKEKLKKEGLFDPAKKRPIPTDLTHLGVISSTAAAGYADFIKIINARWGGLDIQVAHTAVQGFSAADQIIKALEYFNQQKNVEAIAILRGGGSVDDLAVFNDEKLARAVAASGIPVVSGIGHEVDESLVDLVADLRASTPSNAAELLTRDKTAQISMIASDLKTAKESINQKIITEAERIKNQLKDATHQVTQKIISEQQKIDGSIKVLESLNPERILARGYAIMTGNVAPGNIVKITTLKENIKAEVKNVTKR